MAKRKVPSQAASGAETFNDFLVGRQITDGTSALTNTVFALDKSIPEKDSKSFRKNPFSDFLTLETLKEEVAPTTTTSSKGTKRSDTIKNSSKNSAIPVKKLPNTPITRLFTPSVTA